MMRIGVLIIVLSLTGKCWSQPKLTQLWVSDTILKTPESVVFDGAGKRLLVSCMHNNLTEKKGTGTIAAIDLDGKPISMVWSTTLNSPKGMLLVNDFVFVTDINEVVAIDARNGNILKRVTVDGAVFLNDIAVAEDGMIYVSDTRTGRIYKIEQLKASLYTEGLKNPNGLLCLGKDLYVLANGNLIKYDEKRQATILATGMEASTDGLIMVNKKDFLVSCWNGVIYYVTGEGKVTQLLDVRNEKINTADIGYDFKKKIVYVPNFYKNTVTAYQLSF
ncbi:MAG: SMP-30/gluconolactonase/LRE family protein [Chitinophagaceae bacterium]